MGTIILIRHGEVAWNKQACYTGWTDLPLNETGIEQAGSLAERLKDEPLAAVYCSDLQRARKTAEIVGACHNLAPTVDPDLRELNYGEWEGIPEVELPERYPELYAGWAVDNASVRTPSGESFSELRDRAVAAMERIMAAHPESTVAVVAHKSVIRMLICHWMEIDINLYRRIGQDNAAINIISFGPNGIQIDVTNDICHLQGRLVTGGN